MHLHVPEKEMFLDFWCNYSVSVPDNKEFNLLMWNAFDLSKQVFMSWALSRVKGHSLPESRRAGTQDHGWEPCG